jgi:hypothetical protein
MPSTSIPKQKTLKEEHIFFCFDVLNAKLSHEELPDNTHVPSGGEEL